MKAFFLDRDGVINESHNVNRADDLVLLPGVPEAVRTLNELGYEAFVVTNQGGVGLGFLRKRDLDKIHRHMSRQIEEGGGKLREIKACIHKPRQGCDCRKPKPGMLLELIERYDIDRSASFMVGDRDVDIGAGHAAGVKTIFIGEKKPAGIIKPDFMFMSLHEAVTQLQERGILH
ncbi:D-glycero-alpha-D-manno-heptose-1,7-bisphosphate 7-phosphatase [Paenibacillus prosopidis]|uniref:D,D-heptose 1,7-bisphosphate phosphatase n=1 Tax=Paenibacillus prosopidis TaxID=630520 RepID=A0A368WB36_9BACL|nr:HAD family hydrolase [Paenibacillus prosopidis]RCW51918.1 D-glycero-D-manno-heptose 1,7-bisphosphate phosphatase [Paenibacillus prosopidis]